MEFNSNENGFSRFAVWSTLGVLGLFLAALVGAFTEIAFGDECPVRLDPVSYSAQFDWQGTQASAKKLKIKVGALASSKSNTALTALIYSDQGCEAVCQVKNFMKEDNFQPIALSMECRGVKFEGLSTPVTLMWSVTHAAAPTLRFGSWASGFEETALRVDVDRLTPATNVAAAQPSVMSN